MVLIWMKLLYVDIRSKGGKKWEILGDWGIHNYAVVGQPSNLVSISDNTQDMFIIWYIFSSEANDTLEIFTYLKV
jgi:hypothetical protein